MKIFPYIVSALFISAITYWIWGSVLNQALIGEGPTYFVEPYTSMVEKGGMRELWGRHDVQALLFFEFVRDIFRDNMRAYMLVLLFGAALVGFSVYLLTKKVSGNIYAGIFAFLLFSANFVGSFEILGLGYYQWFIQRVPNFGIAILGFIFLLKYIEKKQIVGYFLSLFLYLIAVYLARYTIHILPIFVIYPFLSSKDRMRTFAIVLPFILGSFILMEAQSLVAGEGIFEFAKTSFDFLPNVFYQITLLTAPFLLSLPNYSFPGVVIYTTPFVIFIYGAALYFCLKNEKKLTPFLWTMVLAIPLSIYLSIFLNSYFINLYDSSRYLFYSSILISVFWGVVLAILFKKNGLTKILTIVLIVIWFFYNKDLIKTAFVSWQDRHNPVLATIKYVRENRKDFSKGEIIFVPKEVGNYGSGMLEYFYEGLVFAPDISGELKTGKYIFLKYDAEKDAITKDEGATK